MALKKCCENCTYFEEEGLQLIKFSNGDEDFSYEYNYCTHLKRRVSRSGYCNGYYENSSISDRSSYRPY